MTKTEIKIWLDRGLVLCICGDWYKKVHDGMKVTKCPKCGARRRTDEEILDSIRRI